MLALWVSFIPYQALIVALFLFFGFFMNGAAAALAGAAAGAGLTAIDLALALIARAGNVTAARWTYLFRHLHSPPLLELNHSSSF